jgi:hypothetical protein
VSPVPVAVKMTVHSAYPIIITDLCRGSSWALMAENTNGAIARMLGKSGR